MFRFKADHLTTSNLENGTLFELVLEPQPQSQALHIYMLTCKTYPPPLPFYEKQYIYHSGLTFRNTKHDA